MVACPYAGITRIRFRVEAVRGASARASSQPESSSSPYVGRSIARALGTGSFQPIAMACAVAMGWGEPVPNEPIPFGRESGGVRRPSRFGVASPRPSNWRYCR